MRAYTTPTHTFHVQGADLTQFQILISYSMRTGDFCLIPDTVEYDSAKDETIMTVKLTQKQTGYFKRTKEIGIQINWIDKEGNRNATVIKTIDITKNLLDREVRYGEQ